MYYFVIIFVMFGFKNVIVVGLIVVIVNVLFIFVVFKVSFFVMV